MRNTAGELAHGFHFLGLVEFAFEGFAFGYLLTGAEHVFDGTILAAFGLHGNCKPFQLAFFGFDGDFEILHLLADFGKFQAFVEFFAVCRLNHLD